MLTTPPQRCVIDADADARQHTEQQQSSRRRYNRGPSTDCMNMISLIFGCFCGGRHKPGRQFCKAVNMQCYHSGKKGHFSRMCLYDVKINERNKSTPHDNPKRNWQADISCGFDFGKNPPIPRSI